MVNGTADLAVAQNRVLEGIPRSQGIDSADLLGMDRNGSGCDEIPVNVRVCDLRLPLRVITPLFPIAIPRAFQECE